MKNIFSFNMNLATTKREMIAFSNAMIEAVGLTKNDLDCLKRLGITIELVGNHFKPPVLKVAAEGRLIDGRWHNILVVRELYAIGPYGYIGSGSSSRVPESWTIFPEDGTKTVYVPDKETRQLVLDELKKKFKNVRLCFEE